MPEHKIGTKEEWQAARDELELRILAAVFSADPCV